MTTLNIIDALLSLMRLASRFKINWDEVRTVYNLAESEGREVTLAERQAISDKAQLKIDAL